jgi:anti-sigma B factor antagonist
VSGASELRIVTREEPGAAVIELHGDVSADGDGAIKDAYHAATALGRGAVLVNLAGTQYINTSGISVLISVAMEAKQHGVTVVVAGASPHYRKVLDLVRFSTFVSMFDDEAAALASLA